MEDKYTEDFWKERTARLMAGMEWERLYDAREWCSKIPFIPFKQGWLVKVIPPFGGAVARFMVSQDEKNYVSIYLDCYSQLGSWDAPYWEVYPYDGDTFRCSINEINKLVDAIEISLAEINEINDKK
jgi:hypothetical protein